MTTEELKQKLDGLLGKKRLARSLQKQIQRKREEIDCLHAVSFEGTHVQGGEKEPAAEKFVEYIERLEKRYEAVIEEVFAVEDLIAENLACLTETEQTIIIERYMSGKSWRKIQAELHYEERQPYRIAGSALKKLSAKFKDDSK